MANILITGANRGIGAALAKQALKAGHQVVGTSRVVTEALGNWHEWLALDVTDAFSMAQFASAMKGRRVDILICNAGVYPDKGLSLPDYDAAIWAEAMMVNVAGVFATIQAVLPNIRASRGKIAVISSKMGSNQQAGGGSYAYRASKAAVTNLVSNLAVDLRRDEIALAAYHPGWVKTKMGGDAAEIDVTISAQGLLERIETLSMDCTGVFEGYDGTKIPF